MADPIDVHCPHCNQIIVPADRMKSLLNWHNNQHDAISLMVPHVAGTVVLTNADFICTNCGRMVYFRLNEQKLARILRSIKHA